VVAEIPGRDPAAGIVVAGAHLDSWGLGTGALDNGANCIMLLNVARQMARLGLRPRKTVRFVLFSGEEQGLFGSLGYVRAHRDDLDRLAAVAVFDLGTGRITGFSLGGRADLRPHVEAALRPVEAYGATHHTDDAFVGTDNFDFLLEGVPNLVAMQAPANYLEHYHAESDTFDKADLREMQINGAIAAALIWGLAESPERVPRQSRSQIETLLSRTGLVDQMKTFELYEQWKDRARGRVD
jgi:Zn-dependent M28 family amino/carboxypeptidase